MIVQNMIRLPQGFRELTLKLFRCVEARFPGHGHVVIRGFVFLRLVCPALINPHDYYLLVRHVTVVIIVSLCHHCH